MDKLHEIVRNTGYVIEFFGVFIIVIGTLIATLWFLFNVSQLGLLACYEMYRRVFGRSVLLGLDFLIAGDIIRTVVVSHTVTSVVTLAIIVLIRAFLSTTLELGLEGRWPWKVRQEGGQNETHIKKQNQAGMALASHQRPPTGATG